MEARDNRESETIKDHLTMTIGHPKHIDSQSTFFGSPANAPQPVLRCARLGSEAHQAEEACGGRAVVAAEALCQERPFSSKRSGGEAGAGAVDGSAICRCGCFLYPLHA